MNQTIIEIERVEAGIKMKNHTMIGVIEFEKLTDFRDYQLFRK